MNIRHLTRGKTPIKSNQNEKCIYGRIYLTYERYKMSRVLVNAKHRVCLHVAGPGNPSKCSSTTASPKYFAQRADRMHSS